MLRRISLFNAFVIIFTLMVIAAATITVWSLVPSTDSIPNLDEPTAIATPIESTLDEPTAIATPIKFADGASSMTAVLSLIVAILSSGISIWLYRWRRTIVMTGALVPEVWGQIIRDAVNEINKNTAIVEKNKELGEKVANFINAKATETKTEIKSVKEMLLTFQQSLDEKDREIKRLKEGYDTKILHGNLSNLTALHEKSLGIISNDPTNKSLGNFIVLLEDTIESSGVSIDFPEIGMDFALCSDFVEVVGTTSSGEASFSKGQISQVISPYYVIRGAERQIVLKKSKIKYHLPAGE